MNVDQKVLQIIVPMAGKGSRFAEAGYTFPKPLIDINGKPMIQIVIENLKLNIPHKFIFICQEEHYQKYALNDIFTNIVGRENFECVQIHNQTQGAACTTLLAIDHINNDNDIIIANSDQLVDIDLTQFVLDSRNQGLQGNILTFPASHPKWSYARLDSNGYVIEVAEKKPISNKATVGIYYFESGKLYCQEAQKMIQKDIRTNNEFYVCPIYNEVILDGGKVKTWDIEPNQMHGLGTPEDLTTYLDYLKNKNGSRNDNPISSRY